MYWIYRLLHLWRYIAKFVNKSILNKVLLPKSFKIAQKTAFEAKGRRYTTGKVIQRLLFDLFTYLAIYRYR